MSSETLEYVRPWPRSSLPPPRPPATHSADQAVVYLQLRNPEQGGTSPKMETFTGKAKQYGAFPLRVLYLILTFSY